MGVGGGKRAKKDDRKKELASSIAILYHCIKESLLAKNKIRGVM
jgi:hypothetical protein